MSGWALLREPAHASRIQVLATPSTHGAASRSLRVKPVENDHRADDESGIREESEDCCEVAHDARSTVSPARAGLAAPFLDTPLGGPTRRAGCARVSFPQERESAARRDQRLTPETVLPSRSRLCLGRPHLAVGWVCFHAFAGDADETGPRSQGNLDRELGRYAPDSFHPQARGHSDLRRLRRALVAPRTTVAGRGGRPDVRRPGLGHLRPCP